MKLVVSLVLLALYATKVFAIDPQPIPVDSSQVTSDVYDINLEKIVLPPITLFLDAANTYADVKFYDQKIAEEELQLKITKKTWLNYLRLQAAYQYGTNNTYMSNSGDQYPDAYGAFSTATKNWYNAGVTLSIPLDDLFSRKQKSEVNRVRILQIKYEAEKALENRQIIILEAYNEVIKHLAILKVKSEAVALYNAQMQISERDFVYGRIDIISLSLERARRAAAIVDYQESRAALHNAVTLLEMLTKVRVIKN